MKVAIRVMTAKVKGTEHRRELTLIVYLSYPNYVAAKICGVNLNHFSYSHVIKTVLYTHKQSPTSLN